MSKHTPPLPPNSEQLYQEREAEIRRLEHGSRPSQHCFPSPAETGAEVAEILRRQLQHGPLGGGERAIVTEGFPPPIGPGQTRK